MKIGQDLSMMLNKNTNVASRFRRDRNVWVLDVFTKVANENGEQDFPRRE